MIIRNVHDTKPGTESNSEIREAKKDANEVSQTNVSTGLFGRIVIACYCLQNTQKVGMYINGE